MGNRHFDGTNDNISCGSDASIDAFTAFTVGAWVQSAGFVNNGCVFGKNATITTGGWAVITETSGADARTTFLRNWSGGLAAWVPDAYGIVGTARAHVMLTYDGGATTNDPVIYLNGAAVAFTETLTPSGTVTSDAAQSLILGEDGSAASDNVQNVNTFLYHNAIFTAEEVNRAKWWGRPFGGLQVYHPFFTDKVANEGAATADGTATGATMASDFCPPCVRPGMGMGW